jgi:hypothetical protein
MSLIHHITTHVVSQVYSPPPDELHVLLSQFGWLSDVFTSSSALSELKSYSIWKEAVVKGLISVFESDLALAQQQEQSKNVLWVEKVYQDFYAHVIFLLTIAYIFYLDDPEIAPKVTVVPSTLRSLARHRDLEIRKMAFCSLARLGLADAVEHRGLVPRNRKHVPHPI